MIDSLNMKRVVVTAPISVNGASATCAPIDTKNFAWLDVYVTFGAMAAALTALSLQECDTSGGTYTPIPLANFATGTDSSGSAAVLPTTGYAGEIVAFRVDLRGGRKRFIQPVITVGAGAVLLTCDAFLSRPAALPSSEAGRGVVGEIYAQ